MIVLHGALPNAFMDCFLDAFIPMWKSKVQCTGRVFWCDGSVSMLLSILAAVNENILKGEGKTAGKKNLENDFERKKRAGDISGIAMQSCYRDKCIGVKSVRF